VSRRQSYFGLLGARDGVVTSKHDELELESLKGVVTRRYENSLNVTQPLSSVDIWFAAVQTPSSNITGGFCPQTQACIVFKRQARRQSLKVPKKTPRPFTGTLLKNHSKNKYYITFSSPDYPLLHSRPQLPDTYLGLALPCEWGMQITGWRRSRGESTRRVRVFLYWRAYMVDE